MPQSRTTPSRGPNRTPVVVFAALAVVALAAIVAVLVAGGDDDGAEVEPADTADVGGDEATTPAGDGVETTGAPLAPYDPAEATDPAVGEPAPTLVGQNFDGVEFEVEDDGRPKGILFLAHWCGFCQEEVPAVQEWIDDGNAPADVDLYSVATGNTPERPNYPPSEWFEREGWEVPVLVDGDDQAAAIAYGLTAYPYWVFVAADGTVEARHTGQLPIEDLETILASIGSAGTGT